MAKEILIRKKAVSLLQAGGWIVWWPPAKVRFRNNDIFGAFDLVCSKKNKIKFVQLTTLANISTRRKKVEAFLRQDRLKIPSEVWGWHPKNKEFRIVKVC